LVEVLNCQGEEMKENIG
jgi:virulence-associated protein VapD